MTETFGIAKDLITPDIRMTMSGYGSYYGTVYRGVHDDLYVKALLMNDGRESLLLITADLLFHEPGLTEAIQDYALTRYGVRPDCVLLSYTHTHSGPAIKGYDLGQHADHYESFLEARIKSCIDRAFLNTFAGSVSYGFVEGEWNINRRKRVDGKMVNLPNPEGLTDNRLPLLRIMDERGRLRGLLLNYACHPVTVRDTPYLSADFPGRVCQYVETAFFGATGLFFQGAGGNSRPRVTAVGNAFLTRTFDEIDDMSVAMARRISREVSFGAFTPLSLNLAAKQFVIPLSLDVYDKDAFAAAARDERLVPTARNGARFVFEHYEQLADTVPLRAGLVRLADDCYIAALGGEPCVEVKRNIEQTIEQACPGKRMLFFGYLDSTAYIPDDTIIAEGGYEAEGSVFEMALKGKFRAGIDRSIRSSFVNMLKEVAK